MDSASETGVILFSIGSCVRGADLPIEKRDAFIESFRKLKQKVLWKFEDETLPNLPPNVLVRKWIPQTDVLAHKNVVLFITHGGVFGKQEGIFYGVPMLFIPMFSDQVSRLNMSAIEKNVNKISTFSFAMLNVLLIMVTLSCFVSLTSANRRFFKN